jgi:hypothetical protein
MLKLVNRLFGGNAPEEANGKRPTPDGPADTETPG